MRRLPMGVLAVTLWACSSPDDPLPPTPTDPTLQLEASSMRRLTTEQIGVAVEDLLGVTTLSELEPDLIRGGFASVGASEVMLSSRGVEQHAIAMTRAVEQAFARPERLAKLVPCEEANAPDVACATAILTTLGRRAWRRPLSQDELDQYTTLAATVTETTGSRLAGLQAMIAGLLQSPWFIYRVEATTDGGYTGYAMASRMAFLLWGGPPDDALLDAAAAGRLDTAEGVRDEAARMLEDPRAEQGIVSFVRELYQLHRIDHITRDFVSLLEEDRLFELGSQGESLVDLGDQIKRSMREEVEWNYRGALRDDLDLMELLITDRTYVNATMAELYELEPEGNVSETQWSLAKRRRGRQRRGILGTMGLLSLYNKQNATSPTLRGKFVSETFLCREIPPPPPAAATGFEPPEDVSRREALAVHATDPTCAACHAKMDPLGFALDSFDAIGMERREDDWGYRLDLRGDLDGESFNGLAELAWVLRNHPDAERCFTQHLFRYAEGRENESHDATALAWMTDAFASHSFRWKPMLSAFVASSAFRGSPGVEAPRDQTSTQATDDLATIQADVFGGSCAPCHTEAQFGELSLALDAGLRDRLLAPSKQVPAMALVTPGDPDASYLMHKLDGTHEDIGGQGTIMPPSEPVSTTTTERVRAWIAAGAQ